MGKETKAPDGFHVERSFGREIKRTLLLLIIGFWVGFIVEWLGYGRWQQWLMSAPIGIPNLAWLFIASIFIAVIFIK